MVAAEKLCFFSSQVGTSPHLIRTHVAAVPFQPDKQDISENVYHNPPIKRGGGLRLLGHLLSHLHNLIPLEPETPKRPLWICSGHVT